MNEYYNIFNEMRNSIIILDLNNIVKWMNAWAKENLKDDKIKTGTNFDDFFKLDKTEKNKYYGHTHRGEKFYYKKHEIIDLKVKIILLYSLDNFTEDYNKIYCYENIINSINDGIMLTDFRGHVKIFNPVQEALENKRKDEIYDKYLWDFYDYEGESQSEHRKVYNSKKPVVGKYRLMTYKNGQPRYLYYNTYPILKDEEVIGVFSVSKNEEKLEQLLSETIELKRVLANMDYSKEHQDNLSNGSTYTFSDIAGVSEAIKDTIKEAQTIALSDSNVLIIGETGTGKEMFAQSIHNYVNKSEPYIALNCAAIPENLLESILFGSVKGAYTGATDNIGLFEAAGKGTIMLDELQSMPVFMQTKLLRVIQEKKIRKVGDTKTYPIRCRVISAVNEDPMYLMEKGLLRKDLFYRISSLILNIPPLRSRREDITYLTNYFIQKNNRTMKKNISIVSTNLENTLMNYEWPGNVRELEYVVENLMIKVKNNSNILTVDELPSHIKHFLINNKIEQDLKNVNVGDKLLNDILDDVEKRMIVQALDANGWNITHTSKKLGIIRQSLLYRMKRLNIEKLERF